MRTIEPRRHHYVPQVYLKNFINEDHKKIHVYDKKIKKHFTSNIRDIALEKDFYKVPSIEEPMYWEYYFSKEVEPKYPKIVSNLQGYCNLSLNEAKILNNSLKNDIAYILLSQLFRTKKSRRNFHKVAKQSSHKILKELTDTIFSFLPDDDKYRMQKIEIHDDVFTDIELKVFNDPVRVERNKELLIKRNWVIYHNTISKQIPFITSDHPLNYVNYQSNDLGFRDNGIGTNTTIIYFPITKGILLAIYPEHYRPETFGYLNNRVVKINEEKFIRAINNYQFLQCEIQIYGPIKYINWSDIYS